MARRAMDARQVRFPKWPAITAQQCAEKYLKGYPGLPESHSFNCTSTILFYLTQRMHAQRQPGFQRVWNWRHGDFGQSTAQECGIRWKIS